MSGPLSGIRVLDLTHVLNGPFATMLLAHMGAEVIKVEHGAGDRFRHTWMPPDAGHDGYEFLVVNANKKCVTLNLKHEKGKAMFRQLVARSDVVVENFANGVMERLGFSYEELKAINPRIIYAFARGYGSYGPYADMRAFAPMVMASAGWVNAAWQMSGQPGSQVMGIGDESAGVSLALGICAALVGRNATGEGTKIEIAMQEAQMGFMVSSFHTHFEGEPIGGPYFACSDGYVSGQVPEMSDETWRGFVTALGHAEVADTPQFASAAARKAAGKAVRHKVGELVSRFTRAEVLRIFTQFELAVGPVLSIPEVLENEHVKAREAFVEVEHPEAGTVTLLRPWIRFSAMPTAIRHAGPAVGEHNEEVFGELLGLDAERLAELSRDGAI